MLARRTGSPLWAALIVLLGGCKPGLLISGSGADSTQGQLEASPPPNSDLILPPGDGQLVPTEKGVKPPDKGGPKPDQDPNCPTAPRDPAYWPFETNDPWNIPLGSGATYAKETSPGFDPNGGGWLNCTGWSHPIYIAKATDPMRTFYKDGQVCAKVRVPAGATPDPEADADLHVIDENHAKVVENWMCNGPDGSGNYNSAACVVNDLKGPGVYSTWHGVRAYGGSAIGGLIRKGELKNSIPHALAVSVQSWALNKNTPNGLAYVWPASSADNGSESSYGNTGNLHMGSLLAIPPSVNLSSLGLSAPGLQLGRAMQDYGVYITDIGGANIAYYAEPTAAGDITSAVAGDLNKLTALLQVVTNNTSSNRGGGGTRRRCLAPPFIP